MTTDRPYAPKAKKVLRSAWIPAPPPESEPAMVHTRGVVDEDGLWRCSVVGCFCVILGRVCGRGEMGLASYFFLAEFPHTHPHCTALDRALCAMRRCFCSLTRRFTRTSNESTSRRARAVEAGKEIALRKHSGGRSGGKFGRKEHARLIHLHLSTTTHNGEVRSASDG